MRGLGLGCASAESGVGEDFSPCRITGAGSSDLKIGMIAAVTSKPNRLIRIIRNGVDDMRVELNGFFIKLAHPVDSSLSMSHVYESCPRNISLFGEIS